MRLFGTVTAWLESPFEWGFYGLPGYRELCLGWLKFGWLTDELVATVYAGEVVLPVKKPE